MNMENNIDKNKDKNRGQWSNKTEFLLSCIGYAVGIGNITRFPYLCYQSGGGAFLIPYLIMLFLCGIPLFFLEIILGQFSSCGVTGVYRMCPILKGTGYGQTIVNLICVCYYSVIIAYPIRYMGALFSSTLPWTDCNNSWNTENCINVEKLNYTDGVQIKELITPADEYFHIEMLRLSSGITEIGSIVWPMFLCLFITWLLVFLCIIKGVKSVGKVVYFTATFPYVILFCLFIRGITLPGAFKGIQFYIQPDWSKLTDLQVWTNAAIQIFFSLGPGWGGIINMASYNKFYNTATLDAIIIPIVNCGTSIFAGFVVFSVLGYLSESTGLPVDKVSTGGPGLAYRTYPQAIALMPLPKLWAFSFFFMLILLGLDSVFVQIETIVTTFTDENKSLRKHKTLITFGLCTGMFLLSSTMVTEGGMYIIQLLDWYSASIAVLTFCIIEIIIVNYIYGMRRFKNDIYFMLGSYPSKYWIFTWKYVAPITLITILVISVTFNGTVTYNNIAYPNWAIGIGWLSCVSCISCIPIYFIYLSITGKDSIIKNIKHYSKSVNWKPSDDDICLKYEIYLGEKHKEYILKHKY